MYMIISTIFFWDAMSCDIGWAQLAPLAQPRQLPSGLAYLAQPSPRASALQSAHPCPLTSETHLLGHITVHLLHTPARPRATHCVVCLSQRRVSSPQACGFASSLSPSLGTSSYQHGRLLHTLCSGAYDMPPCPYLFPITPCYLSPDRACHRVRQHPYCHFSRFPLFSTSGSREITFFLKSR